MQAIPTRVPLLVILIELAHLPSNDSAMYVKIKELFKFLFTSGNKLYSWSDMNMKLNPAKDYCLFN